MDESVVDRSFESKVEVVGFHTDDDDERWMEGRVDGWMDGRRALAQ